MIKKIKNWLIKIAIKGLIKANKSGKICVIINNIIKNITDKLDKKTK